MDATRLQDRIHWGHNRAARVLGRPTDAYRPRGTFEPLTGSHRYLHLAAAFSPASGECRGPSAYGTALWVGYFDGAYTRPGDYLVQDQDTWFIAEQQSLLPALCVRTNRLISIRRASAPVAAVTGGYGGMTAAETSALLTHWPASVLGLSGGGQGEAGLPSGVSAPTWTVLLPFFEDVVLALGDLVTDDLGRHGVVTAAELSHLGWRLNVKQATT